MNALKILVLVVLIGVFFGLPMYHAWFGLFDRKLAEGELPDRATNSGIDMWDILICLLFFSLLLIGLFTQNIQEKEFSLVLVGIGYSVLLLSFYNNQFVGWKRCLLVLVTVLVFSMVSFFIFGTSADWRFKSGCTLSEALLFPFITCLYVFSTRFVIKLTTKTFPITLSRHYFRVGVHFEPYNRKTTYWDKLWTVWNLVGFPGVVFWFVH